MSLSPAQRDKILEQHEAVVQLTRQGMTAAAIADKLKISRRHVLRHRVAAGITQPQPTPATPEELALAQTLLEDGASYGEVARTLQRTHKTIRKHFPGYGWRPGGIDGAIIRYGNKKLKAL